MGKGNVKQRVQQRRGQQRRQTQTVLIVVVTVLALVAVAVLIALNAPSGTKTPVASDFEGITQSIERKGGIGLAIGSPSAQVTLTEYSDFSCSHCRDLAPTIKQLVDGYVRSGSLRIIYKPVTFVGGPYSVAAARAMICAAEQGKGWEMQEQIWAIYESNSPAAYTDENLAGRAREIGLDTAKFGSCYGSAETTQAIQSVSTEVQAIGVEATPTLFIDGEQFDYTGPAGLFQALEAKIGAPPATSAPSDVPPAP